jgi:hypothetical protein
MARIGDTVRPELGRTDYSGYLQGAQQGAAAMGRGIAQLGAGVGDYFKKQGEDKKDLSGFIQQMEMGAKLYGPESKIGQIMGESAAFAKDENNPLSSRMGIVKQGTPMLNMLLHNSETNFMRDVQNRRLIIEEGDAKSRAEMLRGANEDAESERRGRTKALEWGMGAGDLPSMSAGDAGGLGALLPPKGNMDKMAQAMEGMDGVEKLAFLDEATKRAPNDNFATKTFKETRVDPETGESATFDVERVTVNGLPTETIVASAPHGKLYPSVDEEVSKSEKMARSKASQDRFDGIAKDAVMAEKKLPGMMKVIAGLESGEIRTGLGAESLATGKRMLELVGFNTNVASFEEAVTVMGSGVMDVVSQSKGSSSDKDILLFKSMAAGPAKTPAGNLLILKAGAKFMQRSREETAMISERQRAGDTNAEIDMKVDAFRKENPIITQEEVNSIRGGDGGDPVQPGTGVPATDAMRAHIDRTRGR